MPKIIDWLADKLRPRKKEGAIREYPWEPELRNDAQPKMAPNTTVTPRLPLLVDEDVEDELDPENPEVKRLYGEYYGALDRLKKPLPTASPVDPTESLISNLAVALSGSRNPNILKQGMGIPLALAGQRTEAAQLAHQQEMEAAGLIARTTPQLIGFERNRENTLTRTEAQLKAGELKKQIEQVKGDRQVWMKIADLVGSGKSPDVQTIAGLLMQTSGMDLPSAQKAAQSILAEPAVFQEKILQGKMDSDTAKQQATEAQNKKSNALTILGDDSQPLGALVEAYEAYGHSPENALLMGQQLFATNKQVRDQKKAESDARVKQISQNIKKSESDIRSSKIRITQAWARINKPSASGAKGAEKPQTTPQMRASYNFLDKQITTAQNMIGAVKNALEIAQSVSGFGVDLPVVVGGEGAPKFKNTEEAMQWIADTQEQVQEWQTQQEELMAGLGMGTLPGKGGAVKAKGYQQTGKGTQFKVLDSGR